MKNLKNMYLLSVVGYVEAYSVIPFMYSLWVLTFVTIKKLISNRDEILVDNSVNKSKRVVVVHADTWCYEGLH